MAPPKKIKKPWYRASISGGKDSMAMLIRMLEEGFKLDEVLYVDTTLDWECVYKNQDLVKQMCEEHGVKYTRVRAPHSYDWYAIFGRRDSYARKAIHWDTYNIHWGIPVKPHRKWCLHTLKRKATDNRPGVKEFKREYRIINYIGIAADEAQAGRPLGDLNKRQEDAIYPLIDWGMTEADCLQYCYDHGIDFDGMYEWVGRLSCWCCASVPKHAVFDCWKHRYDKFKTLYAREHILQRVVKNDPFGYKTHYRIFGAMGERTYYPIEQIDLLCGYKEFTYGKYLYRQFLKHKLAGELVAEGVRRSKLVLENMEALPLNLEQLVDLPENWDSYPKTKEEWIERVHNRYESDKAFFDRPESPYYGTFQGYVPEYYVKRDGTMFLYTQDEFSDWLHSIEYPLDRDSDIAFYRELNRRYGIIGEENTESVLRNK